ncbi:MAG: T9SS type A sorting domain-containing protein [Cytophagales bacterium]|nr:T9SS type A sorting domain-containing protein [Cytophagales bacterium]
MKKNYSLIALAVCLLSFSSAFAQTFWTGPKITFTKADDTDHTLPENQDSLTSNVIITRRSSGGPIFNIAKGSDLTGTEWALGTIEDGIENLTFSAWGNNITGGSAVSSGDLVLHLIEDDIYIDIKFTAWSSGNGDGEGGPGGFSYERSTPAAKEPVFWTGPKITFTKADNADHTLAENQDSLTPKVIITRASSEGIFNIAQESRYDGQFTTDTYQAPKGTEWAKGTIADGVENLTFNTWKATIGGARNITSQGNMVLHLVEENIYIDIEFTEWTQGGGGGGFAYERSTPTVVTNTVETVQTVTTVYPNPANNSIQVLGANSSANYSILNVLGNEVSNGSLANGNQIDVQALATGIYFLVLDNGNIVKFIKE